MNIEIRNRFTGNVIISGEYKSIIEVVEKNKNNLSGAYLYGANLSMANLSGADLTDIQHYNQSHQVAFEIIRRQKRNAFTPKEWSVIGEISMHLPCWETIINKYGKTAISICKKLAKVGYDEYYKTIKNIINKGIE